MKRFFWDLVCIHSRVWFGKHFKLYATFLSSLSKYLHCCISCVRSFGGALDRNSTVREALNNYWLGNCNHNSNNNSNRDQLNADLSQTKNKNNTTVSTFFKVYIVCTNPTHFSQSLPLLWKCTRKCRFFLAFYGLNCMVLPLNSHDIKDIHTKNNISSYISLVIKYDIVKVMFLLVKFISRLFLF